MMVRWFVMRRRRIRHAPILMALALLYSGMSEAHGQLVDSLQSFIGLQTTYFDIYAPSRLESEALRLSTFADGTYTMLTDFFAAAPTKRRIPILIIDSGYSLNGFTTLYPSQKIVIFLASADPRSQLATLQDELYSVFLHELVHYVTLSEKSRGWQALAWLGGDWVAPEVWVMPQSIVEGTAVWAESRLSELQGAASELDWRVRRSGAGRLNDAAALEIVRTERAQRVNRDFWDVSGFEDFYGSGSLPYLYGGLFIEYLSERFGQNVVGKLWQSAERGNIFQGFEGTLASKGILEQETGEKPKILWQDFIAWLDENREETQNDNSMEIFRGYIGALGAGEGFVYFVDLDRRGVYRIDESGKREWLFAADGNLRNIFFNVKFSRLDLDWTRTTPTNQQLPARYHFDLLRRRLAYASDLEKAQPSEAFAENSDSSTGAKFLYDPWIDSDTGISYGLVRIGTTIAPSRKLPNGAMQYADIPHHVLRWISQGFRSGVTSSDSIRFALQVSTENGSSRLGLLEMENGKWTFSVENFSPAGGVYQPIFFDDHHIVYKSSEKDGKSSLRMLDISQIIFETTPLEWVSLSEWMADHPEVISSSKYQQISDFGTQKMSSSRFPRAFATSRLPYADGSLIGLNVVGSDLSERFSWSILSGWDYLLQRPTNSVLFQLGTSAWQIGLVASDQAIASSTTARRSSGALSLLWHRTLMPTFRNFSIDAMGAFSNIQSNYPLSDVFRLSSDYVSFAIGTAASYASCYASRNAPHDAQGFSAKVGAEYEFANIAGYGGLALSGSTSAHGRLSASLYGAVAPFGGVAFSPGMRYLESSGSTKISAIDIPYPTYLEYKSLRSSSRWYVYGEADARLFSVELGKILQLPLMPSIGIRRVVGNIGLRSAALTIENSPGILSSAFAKITADVAILAGLGGATHSHLWVEAAWAFQSDTAGGSPIHISAGVYASLQ